MTGPVAGKVTRRAPSLKVRKIEGRWWVLFRDLRPLQWWPTHDRAVTAANQISASFGTYR